MLYLKTSCLSTNKYDYLFKLHLFLSIIGCLLFKLQQYITHFQAEFATHSCAHYTYFTCKLFLIDGCVDKVEAKALCKAKCMNNTDQVLPFVFSKILVNIRLMFLWEVVLRNSIVLLYLKCKRQTEKPTNYKLAGYIVVALCFKSNKVSVKLNQSCISILY